MLLMVWAFLVFLKQTISWVVRVFKCYILAAVERGSDRVECVSSAALQCEEELGQGRRCLGNAVSSQLRDLVMQPQVKTEDELKRKDRQGWLVMKYNAVRVGVQLGVNSLWEECARNVIGFKGAVHRDFRTKEEAKRFCRFK